MDDIDILNYKNFLLTRLDKSIINPYLDKGYTLKFEDSVLLMSRWRILNEVLFITRESEIVLIFKKKSIVTACDLITFIINTTSYKSEFNFTCNLIDNFLILDLMIGDDFEIVFKTNDDFDLNDLQHTLIYKVVSSSPDTYYKGIMLNTNIN